MSMCVIDDILYFYESVIIRHSSVISLSECLYILTVVGLHKTVGIKVNLIYV